MECMSGGEGEEREADRWRKWTREGADVADMKIDVAGEDFATSS